MKYVLKSFWFITLWGPDLCLGWHTRTVARCSKELPLLKLAITSSPIVNLPVPEIIWISSNFGKQLFVTSIPSKYAVNSVPGRRPFPSNWIFLDLINWELSLLTTLSPTEIEFPVVGSSVILVPVLEVEPDS